ncbi:PREDICTED: putative extracellular sulfatase Sulf-1 homolog isoform X2 [Priapulus caudatus]|uniref:Extracellular sulfatase Sulf-1 homolog isoform X2 n=1 Tax=Priapulus caudatus TaxID=37621 RepID=A0ABM1EEM1_PRICU|nr:PREDICTED: putative extracellular sulfatase Sulf-1 homolog isoform X2 [Priapulus caudatus]
MMLASDKMHPSLIIAFVMCAASISGVSGRSQQGLGAYYGRRKPSNKPNIVLVLTDDQDYQLGSMKYMPKTLRHLAKEGATFTNSFVSTPMCCPSRSSLLTGLYTHNHNVYTNNDNCSSTEWQQTHETRTFATYLNNAGYRTGYFGKYLNEYNGTYIPPGWREWVGLIRNSRYYNYTINFNGKKIHHAWDYHKDYFTDLIANDSMSFLKLSKQYFPNRPVMMVLSMPAPHGTEDSAPQYAHLFPNATDYMDLLSYDYAPNPDKQWMLQQVGKMEPIHHEFTRMLHRKRLQTLQSVDDAVEKIVEELKLLGELDNTYIIYTSDHGYHLGHFGLVKGKSMPYEFDIRVPMYIRGPGIPKGVSIPNIVGNIDVAPTILDMAGIEVPDHMDGRSFKKLFHGGTEDSNIIDGTMKMKKAWRDTFLVSRGKVTNKMLKDLVRLENKGEFSKEARLAKECSKPEYASPCIMHQQFECILDEGGRWRKHKCRHGSMKTGVCVCRSKKAEQEEVRSERSKQRAFLEQHVSKGKGKSKEFNPMFIKPPRQRLPRNLEKRQRHLKKKQKKKKKEKRRKLARENRESRLGNYQNSVTAASNETIVGWQPPVTNRTFTAAAQPDAGCITYPNNSVECDPHIFSDVEVWKKHKQTIDWRIRFYKQELDQLKDIRQHLKDQRPALSRYEDDGQPCVCDSEGRTTDDVVEADDYIDIMLGGNSKYGVVRGRDKQRAKWSRAGRKGRHPPFRYRDKKDFDIFKQNYRYNRRGLKKDNKKAMMSREELNAEVRRQKKRQRKNSKSKDFCNLKNINCFSHDNDHWRTPPLWTLGPFCSCQQSNNNTYWCIRTINETHNFLYCEFITGFLSFYNLTNDPYQLVNQLQDVDESILQVMHATLNKLRKCQGSRECTIRYRPPAVTGQGRPGAEVTEVATSEEEAAADRNDTVDIVDDDSDHWNPTSRK